MIPQLQGTRCPLPGIEAKQCGQEHGHGTHQLSPHELYGLGEIIPFPGG